jgi:hypothetical protein
VALLLVVCATAVACGSRVDDTTTVAAPGAAPSTVALVTSTTTALRDVTQAVPSAPSSSATATSLAPVATSTTSTSAPAPAAETPTTGPPPTTAPPPGPTTPPFDKASFCAASKVYAIDDLLGLGGRVVGDPAGLLRAYETMTTSAPPELKQPVQELGPITREAAGLVQRGEITTAEKLQAWLADTAPRAELEQWVLAQQTIAPAVRALCA